MANRLPTPGGDENDWGAILNDFLDVEHNDDGSLKIRTDGTIPTKLSQLSGDVDTATPSDGQVLSYNTASSEWVPATISSSAVSDATSSTPGLIQLAGDIGGTATTPTVPGLSTKLDTSQLDTDGALSADSDTHIASQKATKTYVDTQVAGGTTPDATTTTKGKVQLAGDLGGVGSTAAAPIVKNVAKMLNVLDYGATGNGSTDDTAAIRLAIAAASAGDIVYLPSGTYVTSAPLVIPPGVTLRGSHSNTIQTTAYGAAIKPSASWAQGSAAAAAVILIVDQTTGGYSMASGEQIIESLTIDGSALSATADGIQLLGSINGGILRDLSINKVTGNGINQVSNASGTSGTWRCSRIITNNNDKAGFVAIANDTTWTDCESLGDGRGGLYAAWNISSGGNCKFIGCRAEWASGSGFYVVNSTAYNLAQTMTFTACSTDRNEQFGFYLTGTAKTAVNVTGCYFHRDGRNGGAGGGNYATINVYNYAGSVIFSGCSTAAGVDDDGSQTNSPEYALRTYGTNGTIIADGCVLHGATTAVNNAGTNSFFLISPSCILATGADSGPTYANAPALPVGSGGTGAATLTGLVKGNGASALSAATAGTDYTSPSGTEALTNKRVTNRVLVLSANSATPAIDTDNYDVVHITAQTTAITSFTSGLTGTPVDGDTLRISVTGTASVSLTFGTSFESSTVSLPTTTSSTTRLDIGLFWDSETNKWRCVAVA